MKQFSLTSNSLNKSQKIQNQTENLFHINSISICDKDFDLTNYLEIIQEKEKIEKKNRSLFSKRFPHFNYSKLQKSNKILSPLKTNFNNFLSNTTTSKKSLGKISTPTYINTNYSNYNTNNISTNYSKNQNTTNFFMNTKSRTNFYYSSKNLIKSKLNSIYNYNKKNKNDYFNVYKTVKKIKISSRDKMSKNNENLVYNTQYIDSVLDAYKLLNNYYDRKKIELDQPESINTFLTQNKEIAVKNVMLKLMNDEIEKSNEKEKNNSKIIENNIKTMKNDEKNFEHYTNIQKATCKNIENLLIKLQNENNRLLEEERINKGYNKLCQDDIIKVLDQIDDLRIYAIFVNQVIGKDTTKFQNCVMPPLNETQKYDQIASDVIENYKLYLTDKNNSEFELLNDPDILLNRFNEIELGIVRLMKNKEEIIAQTKQYHEQNIKNLSELNRRYNDLQNEYEIEKIRYERECTAMNSLKSRDYIINENKEYENYIKELNKCMSLIFNKINFLDKKKQKEKEKYNLDFYLNDTLKILSEKEALINILLEQIGNYVKNDARFFNKVIDNIKTANKERKMAEFKKNRHAAMNEAKTKKKIEKLIFINRRCGTIVHKDNKKEKQPIDYKLIKRLENEELLTYE